MANVLNLDKQVTIIGSLAEGSSIRSIERMTGVHRDTIMRLLVSTGENCADILDKGAMGTIESHGMLACIGIREPKSNWTTGARPSMAKPGRMPAAKHNAANTNIARREKPSTSLACSAALPRGRPRKLTPKELGTVDAEFLETG